MILTLIMAASTTSLQADDVQYTCSGVPASALNACSSNPSVFGIVKVPSKTQTCQSASDLYNCMISKPEL